MFSRFHASIWYSGTLVGAFLLAACGLPQSSERTPTTAFRDTGGTTLGKQVRGKSASHPGQSGMHLLRDSGDAIAARLALADAAERSLDVQYYIWKKDTLGRVLIERLLRAADRGVRVRLLLDDVGTMADDDDLLVVDSHPNIEVRLFNPARLRSPRLLGVIGDFARMNRRMHNKSFTADGQVAIVGGRNIGDEYYGASEGANFADLDVAVIGPVVREVSAKFDLYWNHRASVPVTSLAHQRTTPEEYAERRAALAAHHAEVGRSEYAEKVRNSEFARQLRARNLDFKWGKSSVFCDHPDKVLLPPEDDDTHLVPKLREMAMGTTKELYLVSPYFVPGERGTALLAEISRRGVRVVVITNSLASTDGVPVHSGYKRYRKPLLEAGVELYEIKPTQSAKRRRHIGGSSGASLHAKTFSFDRREIFIGSYNLDPRSNRLNTEMGVVIDCPELARFLPETADPELGETAYRVRLQNGKLEWVSRDGDGERIHHSEPEAGAMKRIMATVFGWLPIEGLL